MCLLVCYEDEENTNGAHELHMDGASVLKTFMVTNKINDMD